MKKVSFNIVLLLIFVSLPLIFMSCGGGASSSGPDGGVSGLGYYDFFNGHTWSRTDGSGKTSFIFANGKVTRKEFTQSGSSWTATYSGTEKSYTLTNLTEHGAHGTITTEDMFSNNPAQYSFLNDSTVVLSYNAYAYTYTRED